MLSKPFFVKCHSCLKSVLYQAEIFNNATILTYCCDYCGAENQIPVRNKLLYAACEAMNIKVPFERITSKQWEYLNFLIGEFNLPTEHWRAEISKMINREIKELIELSKSEASKVISLYVEEGRKIGLIK